MFNQKRITLMVHTMLDRNVISWWYGIKKYYVGMVEILKVIPAKMWCLQKAVEQTDETL